MLDLAESNLDSADDNELEAQVTITGNDEKEGLEQRINTYNQVGAIEGKMIYKKALIALTIREREKSWPYETLRRIWKEEYGHYRNEGTDNENLRSPQTETEEECAPRPRVAAKMSLDGEIDVNAIKDKDFL